MNIFGHRGIRMYDFMTINMAYLLINIIVSPKKVFIKVKENQLFKEIYIIFGISACVVFIKAFKAKHVFVTLFNSEYLNAMMTIFNKPIVISVMIYLMGFLFAAILFVVLKMSSKMANFKQYLLSLMSVSAFGLIMQFVFMLLNNKLSEKIIFIGSYVVYMWAIGLSLLAIKSILDISIAKLVFNFCVISIFFIFIIGLQVITPYLLWLTQ
jgi:hypothetical protein